MLCIRTALCFVAIAAHAAAPEPVSKPSPVEVFNHAREKVIEQLKQATNYTCTEVVDRSYYYYVAPANRLGCFNSESKSPKKLYMHDRLRLEVAVSDGGEVFSWRGGERFSNAGIESIVRTGAVSSGSFVGYLNNIFTRGGVVIRYGGRVGDAATAILVFNYDVPLASSNYHIQVSKGKVLAPFHGSFTVDERSFQLTSLEVVMDQPPAHSEICYAGMSIHYQMVRLSGQDSLLAKSYALSMNLLGQRANTNTTAFTDCHAFQGESTIHYTDLTDDPAAASVTGPPQLLPAGVRIHAALTTSINDQASYTGDQVEATLTSPLKLNQFHVTIPKGAKLKGIISKLEFHYEPAPYYAMSVVLDSISMGPVSYRMNALLSTPADGKLALSTLYRIPYDKLPGDDPATGGQFIFLGKSFHTSKTLTATWLTGQLAGE